MQVKVMIVDGIIDAVLMDEEALHAHIDIEVVDYSKYNGKSELLNEIYNNKELREACFTLNTCETDQIER